MADVYYLHQLPYYCSVAMRLFSFHIEALKVYLNHRVKFQYCMIVMRSNLHQELIHSLLYLCLAVFLLIFHLSTKRGCFKVSFNLFELFTATHKRKRAWNFKTTLRQVSWISWLPVTVQQISPPLWRNVELIVEMHRGTYPIVSTLTGVMLTSHSVTVCRLL